MLRLLLVSLFMFSTSSQAAPETVWKAGTAKISIAPHEPVWMAGYAARTKPSEGVALPVHAKALALEDSSGKKSVLVTADLLGFTKRLSQVVAKRAQEKYGLARESILFNASHTHSGPVIDRQLAVAYLIDDKQWAAIDRYTKALEDKLVDVIGQALKKMQPASLSFGRTKAGFAANRRKAFGPGPVQHEVPVLRISGKDGKLLAVVFTYACHNTTLGADFCKLHGDYAGVAQKQIEDRHPGAVAYFVTGCGADANPDPRGTLDHVNRYGSELATAVAEKISGGLRAVSGPLRTAFYIEELDFATPPTRDELKKKLSHENVYERRHAEEMLKIMDRDGQLPTKYSYPLQVWQFGPNLTLIAMAGEVVVDYNLRLRKELGEENTWVAGYSNDVSAYIPSLRILKEGGYEGGGAMIYYVQPGPFAPNVEELITERIHKLVRQVRPAK